ncbi:microtubule associated protein-domain-containing protein [Mycena metata]|uniref:Microtubule associated protein-domain-containing protein n=1 Tax=Mycena metata TaxID=1033252 RepID=A0AAD7NP27_9AGAR|nr:microtubule associated protein-domain-containing protein [Mycena metata]
MSLSSPLTLTTLLNSLHTHLQSQTQLLPTLHAQLGLPPSALEDELETLQQQLMRSVEAQIDTRRKEVENWMEKCESIEAECISYAKALGGNVKATGSSLGELRKEKVLPVRYEMVTEYQEKLRQLYHTKLEQLTTLGNRLSALSRTLGPEFYSQDINDDGEYRDVTPERFSKLEKELVRGKGEVAKRLAHLSDTFIQIDWLYTELGMSPPIPEDEDSYGPSTSRNSIGDDPFLTPSAIDAAHYRILADFIDQVASLSEDTPPRLEVEPTHALISWAMDLRASLEETKRRRETHIQAMYDQLEGLWKRLGVAEADMDAFVETHRGSTEETVGEYEEELERMLELKRERMGTFVGSAREEIDKLWDELMVGEEERMGWIPYYDDEHTEELLTIHEDEIRRLKEEKRMKAPLLAGIKRYFDICEEEKELAAAASDQTRLLGRGARDPGRLLREEKMRKRVSKEKPRLEQDLLTSIPAWEHEAGRPFLVHGQSILHILMRTVGAADQENAGPNVHNSTGKRKPSPSGGPGGRATSVPARATTPTPLSSYAPRAGNGVVTPAVRPAPGNSNSNSQPPNKRARTETTPSYGHGFGKPAVLGAHRGGNGVGGHGRSSPSKIPLSRTTPTGLPMPARGAPPPFGIFPPKPGHGAQMQAGYQALGHGRGPTTGYGGGAMRSASASISTASISSAGSSFGIGGRYASANGQGPSNIQAKAQRARRESFKPRASVDNVDSGAPHAGARWGFEGIMVKEEENEEY